MTGASQDTVWWPNPVLPLPPTGAGADPAAVLDVAGAVYTALGPMVAHGFVVNADGVSVAIQGDGTVRQHAGALPNVVDGELYTGLGAPRRVLLAAGGQRFLWLEGSYSGGGQPVTLYEVNSSRLHRLTARDSFGWGAALSVFRSNGNRLSEVAVANAAADGLVVGESANNLLTDIKVSRCLDDTPGDGGGTGLNFSYSAGSNRAARVVVDNCSIGIYLSNYGIGRGDTITFAFVAGVQTGVWFDGGLGANVVGLTVAHETGVGIGLGNNSGNDDVLVHLAAVVDSGDGVYVDSSGIQRATLSQLALLDDNVGVILGDGADRVKFSGALLVGGNGTDCIVDPGSAGQALVNGTCSADGTVGSTTFPPQSDGTLFPGSSSAGAFVGRVVNASDGADGDDVNTADIAGSATFPATPESFDWLGFEHALRTWGREGTDAPDGAARGLWQSGVGRVWDWRLVPSTSNLFDDTLDPRDGNGGPFIAGQECPTAAHGGYAVHSLNAAGVPEDYLASGVEIVEDNVGDNDGLCETAERCIYAPHFGAYQGEGSLVGPCGFVDVTDGNPTSVEDVTLYSFSTLGA